MKTKKVDLGEYVIVINYEQEDGSLEVVILDEGGEMIDTVIVTNDEDDDDNKLDINLN